MVLPLVNLMKDQVDKLANLGIVVASLSEITEKNARGVVEGKISIVYARPEAKAGLKNISTIDDFHCFAVCDWLNLS